jgi:hypothetical protein
MTQELSDYVREIAKRHAAECERLTTEQLESVLSEALQSGDFERCVSFGGRSQSVTYIPHRKAEQLKATIAELVGLLEEVANSNCGAPLPVDLMSRVRDRAALDNQAPRR